jgi:hypothetical protein
MIITIRDNNALASLNPLEIASYLKFNGWDEVREPRIEASRWYKTDKDEDTIEILLPYDKSIGDYNNRMVDLLTSLEYVENRPQNLIFNDLKNVFSDIIRFFVPSSDTEGTIPITIGSGAYQDINDIMVSSACVSISKRAVIPQRKPIQAINYMNNDVRLAQPELGSYVIPVISRVSPQLLKGEQMRLFQTEEPFQRIVTTTLATSLEQLKRNSTDALVKGDIEIFNEGIEYGVNASLCESVANLGKKTSDNNLSINFSWSPSRPLISSVNNSITIQPDIFPILEEAAKYFKEISPIEMFEAIGQIIDLHREPTEKIGKVKMQAFVNNKLKKISFTMGDPIYPQLVQAHHDKKIVVCHGDLVKEGNSYKLNNPVDFSIAPEFITENDSE